MCACAQNETRYAVDLNNFGFYADGILEVNLTSLHLSDESVDFSAQPVSVCVFVLLLFPKAFQLIMVIVAVGGVVLW